MTVLNTCTHFLVKLLSKTAPPEHSRDLQTIHSVAQNSFGPLLGILMCSVAMLLQFGAFIYLAAVILILMGTISVFVVLLKMELSLRKRCRAVQKDLPEVLARGFKFATDCDLVVLSECIELRVAAEEEFKSNDIATFDCVLRDLLMNPKIRKELTEMHQDKL